MPKRNIDPKCSIYNDNFKFMLSLCVNNGLCSYTEETITIGGTLIVGSTPKEYFCVNNERRIEQSQSSEMKIRLNYAF